MSDAVTNTIAVVASPDKKEILRGFIEHHALVHAPDPSAWNIPFFHVKALDWFRFDYVVVPFCALVLIGLALLARRLANQTPRGRLATLVEVFVAFIRDHICVPSLGQVEGRRLTPFFCTIFSFILVMNLMGLVPLFAVATSNINVTGALAVMVLVLMTAGALIRNGPVVFLKTFLIPGVPWPMHFLLAPLEAISLLTKAFALMVRLAANMLAGHIIIFTILGMFFLFGWFALPVVFVAVALFFFELFVAFFQAYIFALLSSIFIGQMYHPHGEDPDGAGHAHAVSQKGTGV